MSFGNLNPFFNYYGEGDSDAIVMADGIATICRSGSMFMGCHRRRRHNDTIPQRIALPLSNVSDDDNDDGQRRRFEHRFGIEIVHVYLLCYANIRRMCARTRSNPTQWRRRRRRQQTPKVFVRLQDK